MAKANKDNRPEAILDRVLENAGVMSQPKSNEGLIAEMRKIVVRYGAEEKEILEVTDLLRTILAQKDAEVAQAHQAGVDEAVEKRIAKVIRNPIRGHDGIANYEYNMGYLDALKALQDKK